VRYFITILTVVLISVLIGGQSGHCKSYQGKVISVSDGDTITVLNSNKEYKIRLYGIDCPENGQAYANKAKQFTSALTYGKTVEFTVYDVDKYRRLVAVVRADGLNVNKAILKNGYAWRYTQYCKESFCNDWVADEYTSRKREIGLWQDKSPIPPWEWRKSIQKRQQSSSNHTEKERQNVDIEKSRWAIAIKEYKQRKRYQTKSYQSYNYSSSGNYSSGYSTGKSRGKVWVRPYTRKDGTHVDGYYRSR